MYPGRSSASQRRSHLAQRGSSSGPVLVHGCRSIYTNCYPSTCLEERFLAKVLRYTLFSQVRKLKFKQGQMTRPGSLIDATIRIQFMLPDAKPPSLYTHSPLPYCSMPSSFPSSLHPTPRTHCRMTKVTGVALIYRWRKCLQKFSGHSISLG